MRFSFSKPTNSVSQLFSWVLVFTLGNPGRQGRLARRSRWGWGQAGQQAAVGPKPLNILASWPLKAAANSGRELI